MFDEWLYLPEVAGVILGNYKVWGMMILGTVIGYIVGVLPGLGPTMGLALSLGFIMKMPQELGFAFMCAVLVSSIGTGGIMASLANIPGTAAAAATCMDGYALTKQGKSRLAVGISIGSSVIGTISGTMFIFLIQPFVVSIALKFGDWEVFLFCIFGLMICGSLSGDHPIKGWVAALLGLFFALVGAEGVQSVSRFTFDRPELLTGFDKVTALLGLFGLSEVFVILKDKIVISFPSERGMPIISIPLFVRNWANILRSTLAGVWVGFIPGVGESAACWFSYDLAKRASKEKEKFGNGSEEGIVAAEVANNASSVGALIPSLALGIPGSSTTAIFLAAMFLLNYRPGPTLLIESPGILCELSILFVMSALLMGLFAMLISKYVISFLVIPRTIIMPLVVVFCVLGAWGTTYTTFSFVTLLIFGVLGMIMKIYDYPVAPMVLGLLIGEIVDINFRRAILQYAEEPLMLFSRPFGLIVIAALIILFVVGLRTNKKSTRGV